MGGPVLAAWLAALATSTAPTAVSTPPPTPWLTHEEATAMAPQDLARRLLNQLADTIVEVGAEGWGGSSIVLFSKPHAAFGGLCEAAAFETLPVVDGEARAHPKPGEATVTMTNGRVFAEHPPRRADFLTGSHRYRIVGEVNRRPSDRRLAETQQACASLPTAKGFFRAPDAVDAAVVAELLQQAVRKPPAPGANLSCFDYQSEQCDFGKALARIRTDRIGWAERAPFASHADDCPADIGIGRICYRVGVGLVFANGASREASILMVENAGRLERMSIRVGSRLNE